MPSDQAIKVVYKSPDQTEFFVVANHDMRAKWKKDKSIPMIDVVQSKFCVCLVLDVILMFYSF